jgi:two-component sensor histidine kinase
MDQIRPSRGGHGSEPNPGAPAEFAATATRAAFLQAVLSYATASASAGDPDVCAHLFGLCRTLQIEHLDAYGINCLFDVEPGRLPQRACHVLGLIVSALIMDAAAHALAGVDDKTIAVSLRRRGAIWAGSVSHSGGRVNRQAGRGPWRAVADALAAELPADLRSQVSHHGTITALVFDPQRSGAAPLTSACA